MDDEIKIKHENLAAKEVNEENILRNGRNLISFANKYNEKTIEYFNYQERLKTKLFRYCELGNIGKLMIVLDKNQPNDSIPDINSKFLHDYNVLHISVSKNFMEIVNYLLDNGANIEAETSLKRTPLHMAVMKNNYEMTALLLNCGANIDCSDIDGNTPIHFASQLGYDKIVISLLQKKCRIDLKNCEMQNPIDLICNSRIYSIFIRFFGDKLKLLKGDYSRVYHNNCVFHKNRADQIKRILYYERKIIKENKEKKDLNNLLLIKDNISLDSFEIIELVGKGSFGEVYLVKQKKSNLKYAMKILDKKKIKSQNIVRYMITEKNVLSIINHPFIVKLCYSIQTDDFLYLILEYCPNGDLSQHLQQEKEFKEDIVKIISAQILLSIEELHKNNIIYRDLKPENIVLDENFYAKLTDFGLSKEGISDNSSAKSFCGSLAYLAPEVINRQGHGKAVDWYLFGLLIYELIFGLPPYYTIKSKEALFNNIKYGKLNFPKPISDEAKSLITKLLNRNPQKRLGSGTLDSMEVKSHPFYKKVDFQKIYDKNFTPPKMLLNTAKIKHDYSLEISKLNKKIQERKIKPFEKKMNNIEGWTFIRDEQIELK